MLALLNTRRRRPRGTKHPQPDGNLPDERPHSRWMLQHRSSHGRPRPIHLSVKRQLPRRLLGVEHARHGRRQWHELLVRESDPAKRHTGF
jgi:hypothetical protein